jgi:hypothetical protein
MDEMKVPYRLLKAMRWTVRLAVKQCRASVQGTNSKEIREPRWLSLVRQGLDANQQQFNGQPCNDLPTTCLEAVGLSVGLKGSPNLLWRAPTGTLTRRQRFLKSLFRVRKSTARHGVRSVMETNNQGFEPSSGL